MQAASGAPMFSANAICIWPNQGEDYPPQTGVQGAFLAALASSYSGMHYLHQTQYDWV